MRRLGECKQGNARDGLLVYEKNPWHTHRSEAQPGSESVHRYLHGDSEAKDAPMYL